MEPCDVPGGIISHPPWVMDSDSQLPSGISNRGYLFTNLNALDELLGVRRPVRTHAKSVVRCDVVGVLWYGTLIYK